MSDKLSGPEMMMRQIMKVMGINPQDLIDKFQEPVEQGLKGIKDVNERLARLEINIATIMQHLGVSENDGTDDNSGGSIRLIAGRADQRDAGGNDLDRDDFRSYGS